MNNKILKHKLKKGDFIVDLNGEDTKGLGLGMVMSVYENKTFFTVLFKDDCLDAELLKKISLI